MVHNEGDHSRAALRRAAGGFEMLQTRAIRKYSFRFRGASKVNILFFDNALFYIQKLTYLRAGIAEMWLWGDFRFLAVTRTNL
jgi:hypothetical protein